MNTTRSAALNGNSTHSNTTRNNVSNNSITRNNVSNNSTARNRNVSNSVSKSNGSALNRMFPTGTVPRILMLVLSLMGVWKMVEMIMGWMSPKKVVKKEVKDEPEPNAESEVVEPEVIDEVDEAVVDEVDES